MRVCFEGEGTLKFSQLEGFLLRYFRYCYCLVSFLPMLILHSFVRANFFSNLSLCSLIDLVACTVIEFRFFCFLADRFSTLFLSIKLSV